jgi:zinc protease
MREKKIIVLGLSLLICLALSSASAQLEEPSFPYSSFKLKNGLSVILSVDESLPLVSIVVAYRVGSTHDTPGKEGMAYLMVNLMFQGSRNIGPMQHINYLNRIGGEFNAETQADKTIFSQSVPSNQLALVLWLESDRMNSLSINASSVQQAKNSLIEEIQIAKDNDFYRDSSVHFDQLLYSNPAYSHPVIGMDINDIRNISVDDVSNFFSMYYTPNNAVLSIVGNIDMAQSTELIRKYFESIPAGKKLDPINLEKPEETTDIAEIFENIMAPSPGFYLGYRLSAPYTYDYYTLSIIDYLLLQGKSSRLYKRLIRPLIAFHLEGGIEIRKDFTTFKLLVLTNEEMMMERSRRTVFSEINRLRTNLIQDKELQRAKNMFKFDYLNQFETTLGKAVYLAEFYLDNGNLDEPFSELNKYMRVTPARIMRAMNSYFSRGSILLEITIR